MALVLWRYTCDPPYGIRCRSRRSSTPSPLVRKSSACEVSQSTVLRKMAISIPLKARSEISSMTLRRGRCANRLALQRLLRLIVRKVEDLRVSIELNPPSHPHNVLKQGLQDIDKQKEIELYYELLSSGHSVGEILNSRGHLQSKSEHGDATIAKRSQSGSDGEVPNITSEAALVDATGANVPRTPGLSALHDADSCKTAEPEATKSAPFHKLRSGESEPLLGESLAGSQPNFISSTDAHAPADPNVAIHSGSQEPHRPRAFPNVGKWIAFAALSAAAVLSVYTASVVTVSSASFSITRGGHDVEPTTAQAQSDISSRTEAIAIPPAMEGHSETTDEGLKPKEQVVNANTSPVSESSRSAGPGSAVSGSALKDAPKVPAKFSASIAQPEQSGEPSRQVQASAINKHGAVGFETERSGDVSGDGRRRSAGSK